MSIGTTMDDLEWPFHASRAISAVAELLVNNCSYHYRSNSDTGPVPESSTWLVTDSKFLFWFNCTITFKNNKALFEAVVYFGFSYGSDCEFI